MGRLKARASAKFLLFGEHSVLYGYPALGIPLAYFLKIQYKPSSDNQWRFNGLDSAFLPSLLLLLSFYESKWHLLSSKKGELFFSGNIPIGVGFGSSASLCVAFARLFNELLNLNLDSLSLWSISHEAEKIFHGRPSGVDTGLIIWQATSCFWINSQSLPSYKLLNPFSDWWIIVGALPRDEPTKEIITGFTERLEKSPQLQEKLKELGEISARVVKEVSSNFNKLASFINRAQEILHFLGFSNESLDKILTLGKSLGAPAGKLSGAGKGGAFYFLCETKEQADYLCDRIKKKNRDSLVQNLTVLPLRFL